MLSQTKSLNPKTNPKWTLVANYHVTWTVPAPKCCKFHRKWEVRTQKCCKYPWNAASSSKMLQIPPKCCKLYRKWKVPSPRYCKDSWNGSFQLPNAANSKENGQKSRSPKSAKNGKKKPTQFRIFSQKVFLMLSQKVFPRNMTTDNSWGASSELQPLAADGWETTESAAEPVDDVEGPEGCSCGGQRWQKC